MRQCLDFGIIQNSNENNCFCPCIDQANKVVLIVDNNVTSINEKH